MRVKINDSVAYAMFNSPLLGGCEVSFDASPLSNGGTVVFTENRLSFRAKTNPDRAIAWLREPRSYCRHATKGYPWSDFQKVLTFDRDILESCRHSVMFPAGGCWLSTQDIVIHKKTKLISSLNSRKAMFEGQVMRLKIARYVTDSFGFSVGRPLKNKADALRDYAFHVAIENTRQDYYFSEKLIDCFLTGAIPVYWGCPSISKFFNVDGMVIIESVSQGIDAIKTLTMDLYDSRILAVKDNFKRALEFAIPEVYGLKNGLFV